MDTNAEIRRRRLAALCAQRGAAEVAARAGLSAVYLDQILKSRPGRKPKDGDKAAKARGLGDDAARLIEAALDLGIGWFDWPFDNVDFKAWAALDVHQRLWVESSLASSIAQAQHVKLPDYVTKPAAPDKKVEQAYGTPTDKPATKVKERAI